ncbi:MAG: hypothetical protein SFV15_05025 [Polyangiaceae bacterium]|nr:hypothetical protein [Polyangiaceae bacterium]
MSRIPAFLIATLLAGCGGAPAAHAPKPPTQVLAAPNAGAEVVAVPTPVTAPEDIVGVLRVKNPAALLDTLTDWAHLPLDWKTLAASRMPGLTEVVALDAPLEALAMLAPPSGKTVDEPLAALSVGLKSLARAVQFARDQGQDAERIEPDIYQLGSVLGSPCAMGPALGKTPARLVCGMDEQSLRALMPYATRGLPLVALPTTDLHVELRADPLRRRYAEKLERLSALAPLALSQLGQDHPVFDRALGDAVHALTAEALALVQDLEAITIDSSADVGQSKLDLEVGVNFRKKTSWMAQIVDDLTSQSGTAPPLFWRLPKDATTASFRFKGSTRGKDAIRTTITNLAEGFADHEGLPESLQKDIGSLLQLGFDFAPEQMVSASGELAQNPFPNLGRGPVDSMLRSQLKWTVIGYPGAPTSSKEALGLLTRLVNHASLKSLAKKGGIEAKWLPRAKLQPAPKLGKGAELMEVRLPAALLDKLDKKSKHKDFSFYVAVVPEGDVTWLLTAPSEAIIAERVRLLKAGPTLADRADLSSLKSERAFSAGFLQLPALLSSLEPEVAQKVRSVLNTTKNHGESPAFFFSRPTKIGAGVRMSVSLVVPRDLIADGAAAVAAASF